MTKEGGKTLFQNRTDDHIQLIIKVVKNSLELFKNEIQ